MTEVDARPKPDEAAERARLEYVIERLGLEAERLDAAISRSATSIDESKRHIWSHQRDMDHAEKASMRTEVGVAVSVADGSVAARRRVARLLDSPYFGRVDFRADEEPDAEGYYIGLHSFRDRDSLELLTHDWRAPVSSLYYDYESGEAEYATPEGSVHGDIDGKRQYKIVGGSLEYMLESTLNIGDDVLQRELSESTDDKMNNIVATIQREQNAVIRNETADVLILQGVAGSGKTSIALHRVAFLLYRFADTLSSDNVMILSPNKVFGDYIGSVLPELGEEQVKEIDFGALARTFLTKVTDYETFSDQVIALLEGADEGAIARMRYKASTEFVAELDHWLASRIDEEFAPAEIRHRAMSLSKQWVAGRFATMQTVPLFTRLERLAEAAVHQFKSKLSEGSTTGPKWAAKDATAVRAQVRAMFPHKDALALYRAFYEAPNREGMFAPAGRRTVEHADVFPLIYTILATTRHPGSKSFESVRHLVVDEMQDYTPIQYAVLRQLFSCKMTILGDSNQKVNPFSASSVEAIRRVFPEADGLELNKSYRSTTEITEFAQAISRNDRLVPINRHGPAPAIRAFDDDAAQSAEIVALTTELRARGHRSVGIVCKTIARAQELYGVLEASGADLTLLDYGSEAFAAGTVITSAHISKGLEFDAVIVPDADAGTYANAMDRSMLYIACTRAMHELHLTHTDEPTAFVDFALTAAR
ncbi:HelD family protein [Demequina sp. SO4-13]|uniref:HelD family protein n=1 Tax=Demequina sp. SO4-13 TaxID=3401027 RepID=UPI003AF54A93